MIEVALLAFGFLVGTFVAPKRAEWAVARARDARDRFQDALDLAVERNARLERERDDALTHASRVAKLNRQLVYEAEHAQAQAAMTREREVALLERLEVAETGGDRDWAEEARPSEAGDPS